MKPLHSKEQLSVLARLWFLFNIVIGYRPMSDMDLMRDDRGEINVAEIAIVVIGIVVLVVVAAALMPTFYDSLFDYDNASPDALAPILRTIGPLLLTVAILLTMLGALLYKRLSA